MKVRELPNVREVVDENLRGDVQSHLLVMYGALSEYGTDLSKLVLVDCDLGKEPEFRSYLAKLVSDWQYLSILMEPILKAYDEAECDADDIIDVPFPVKL